MMVATQGKDPEQSVQEQLKRTLEQLKHADEYYSIYYDTLGLLDADEDSPNFHVYKSDTSTPSLQNAVSKEIKDRDKNYSKLLKSYVRTTRARNILKEFHKWALFWGMVYACVKGYQLIEKILNPILSSNNVDVLVAAIPVLVTSLVAFISAIIAVPLAVVKFLFNAKEDDNITEIIKHTQEHDAAGRIWVKLDRGSTAQDEGEAEGSDGTAKDASPTDQ